MTKRIKLTEDDIRINLWDEHFDWYQIEILKKRPEGGSGWDGYPKKEAKQLKQQILDDQEKLEKIKEFLQTEEKEPECRTCHS